MEDQIGQLAAVAALRGEGVHAGAVFFWGILGHAPLLQALFDFRGELFLALIRMPLGRQRQLVEVLRRARWWGLPRLVVIPGARQDAAHQGNGQEDEDGLEPDGRKDVEKLQLVVDLRHVAVGLDEVLHVLLVEVALRQQGTGNRGQRQQEKQRQRRAHAGQPMPGFAEIFHVSPKSGLRQSCRSTGG